MIFIDFSLIFIDFSLIFRAGTRPDDVDADDDDDDIKVVRALDAAAHEN